VRNIESAAFQRRCLFAGRGDFRATDKFGLDQSLALLIDLVEEEFEIGLGHLAAGIERR
jgi:hypothetical protein